MNLKAVNSFFEKFWLVVAIGTLAYGIYTVMTLGVEGNEKFLLYPFIAFFLYFMRRYMRKRLERSTAESES